LNLEKLFVKRSDTMGTHCVCIRKATKNKRATISQDYNSFSSVRLFIYTSAHYKSKPTEQNPRCIKHMLSDYVDFEVLIQYFDYDGESSVPGNAELSDNNCWHDITIRNILNAPQYAPYKHSSRRFYNMPRVYVENFVTDVLRAFGICPGPWMTEEEKAASNVPT